jgi:AcrR family transcriptional regulator
MSRASSRRAVQAAETKRVILDAALRLFTARGYGATSVGQIAEEAGVAIPTVYVSAGTKPALLRHLIDRLDEQAGVPGLAAELVSSDDALNVLGLSIRLIRQLAERCGDIIAALRSAAGVEPEMAELHAAGLARHRAGAELTVGRLADLGRLRPDVAPERATAILATLSSPATYASLTGDYGWSFNQCEAWLQDLLRHQLLAPPARQAEDEPAADSPAQTGPAQRRAEVHHAHPPVHAKPSKHSTDHSPAGPPAQYPQI